MPHSNLQHMVKTSDVVHGLTRTERAKVACRVAKEQEKAGEYFAAYEVLAEFWPDSSSEPKTDDLDDAVRAEVLVRAGSLAGWLGAAGSTPGSQELAKNLITQGIELFELLQQPDKVAEARGDLSLCYWREGSYDEARITLDSALQIAPQEMTDLRATLLTRAATVALAAHRLSDAFRTFSVAAPLVEQSNDHA